VRNRGFILLVALAGAGGLGLAACSGTDLHAGDTVGGGGHAGSAAGAAGSIMPAGTGGGSGGSTGSPGGTGGVTPIGGNTGTGGVTPIGGNTGTGGVGGGSGAAAPRFLNLTPVDSSGAPKTDQPYGVLLSGASDDGSVVAGTWMSATDSGTSYYWTAETGVVRLDPPSGSSHTMGFWPNVSPDGTRLFGRDSAGFYQWTKQAGYEVFDAAVPAFGGPGADTELAFSRDGTVAWGVAADSSHLLPFRWRPSDGVRSYLSIAGWPANGIYAEYLSSATCGSCGIVRGTSAFSDDGKVVAGYHQPNLALPTAPSRGFIWSEPGTLYELTPMPGTTGCSVSALSRDGTVAFGSCSDPTVVVPPPPKAFRWTAATGMVALGENVYYHDTTRDGRIAMGGDDAANVLHRWTADKGAVLLDPSGSALDPARYAVRMTMGSLSDDGGSAYGRAPRIDFKPGPEEEGREDAFVWSTARGFAVLDTLPGYDISTIWGASPDGSLQVGMLRTRQGNPTGLPELGVLWDCRGVRDIAAELTAAGVDIQGIWLYNPVRVWSGASIMIVGYGLFNGNTSTRAWIAWLPRRC
jgi:hypothetical protein